MRGAKKGDLSPSWIMQFLAQQRPSVVRRHACDSPAGKELLVCEVEKSVSIVTPLSNEAVDVAQLLEELLRPLLGLQLLPRRGLERIGSFVLEVAQSKRPEHVFSRGGVARSVQLKPKCEIREM